MDKLSHVLRGLFRISSSSSLTHTLQYIFKQTNKPSPNSVKEPSATAASLKCSSFSHCPLLGYLGLFWLYSPPSWCICIQSTSPLVCSNLFSQLIQQVIFFTVKVCQLLSLCGPSLPTDTLFYILFTDDCSFFLV